MGGKKVLAVALGVVVMIVVLLLTVLGDDPGDECVDGARGRSLSGGVADGEFSLPEKHALAHLGSGWRVPERPDHRGVDIPQGAGTPIYAFADGVVVAAGAATGFGQWIVIDHEYGGEKFSTVYGHMFPQHVLVKAGDRVKAGQHIAHEGYNGEVSPPGPGGSHLHFEVWQPSRLDGGQDVNPVPWLNKAVEPGTGGSGKATDSQEDPRVKETQPGDTPRRSSGGALPPSDKIANEEHLQVDSIRVARSVAQRFPEIETIGGWRPYDPFPDHPSGRAVDVMIPDWDGDTGRRLGDEIRDYLYANREDFHIEYMIWRQEYIPSQGQGNVMEDRGSPTQNHFDHVHVTTVGGGFPGPDHEFAPAPEGGSSSPPMGDACGGVGLHPDEGLETAQIPPELVKWIGLGGQVCREVSSPLLAGLLYHESGGFHADAVSPVGAQGYAQFMPATWASVGAKVDEQGQVVGPAGSGSPSDPADATMAAARYLCGIAKDQAPLLSSGAISGDRTELMLAAYNAGPGAVQAHGGVPPFKETLNYVQVVPKEAEKFTAATGKVADQRHAGGHDDKADAKE